MCCEEKQTKNRNEKKYKKFVGGKRMIVAEIYVPVLDASYDFKLDENVPTGVVIEEIASVICQKEQCEIGGDKTQFMLFKVENRQSLSANLTLYENGVTTGDSLVFV